MFRIKKCVIAIFLVSSCCFASLKDYVFKTQDDVEHFVMELGFKSKVVYKLNSENCADWIKAGTYKNSIYNVISTAIADCYYEKNEFANDKVQDGVVTFENKEYKDYKAEHWNAVVLYNLVNFICCEISADDIEALDFEKVMDDFYNEYINNERLINIYGKEYAEKIQDAFCDIQEYDKNLGIIEFIMTDGASFAGTCSRICEEFEENGLAKIEIISSNLNTPFSYRSDNATITNSNINIYIEHGKLAEAVVYEDLKMCAADFDEYMNITYVGEAEEYPNPKVYEESAQRILEDIHNAENLFANATQEIQLVSGFIAGSQQEKLFGIIDVGTYADKNGDLHLAWLDIDRCYLDKAYYSETSYADSMVILLDESIKDLHIDMRCLNGLDIINTINNIDYVYTFYLNTSPAEIIMPKDCRDLINNSASIATISLNNTNFKDAENIESMINSNNSLRDVRISLLNTKDISKIITQNRGLEYVLLDFYNNKTNITYAVNSIITDCNKLKVVQYIGTGASRNEPDTILKIHKMEWGCFPPKLESEMYPGCGEDDLTVDFFDSVADYGKATPYIRFSRDKYKRTIEIFSDRPVDEHNEDAPEENNEEAENDEQQEESNEGNTSRDN